MPIISMNIEKDVEQVAGLDEKEYLDKGGRIEKFNEDTEKTETNQIVKPKAKKVKTQKQLDRFSKCQRKEKTKGGGKKETTENCRTSKTCRNFRRN